MKSLVAFVGLVGLIASVAAEGSGEALTVRKDGKEYVIATKKQTSVDPCLRFKTFEMCEEQATCGGIQIGDRFICLKTERVEILHNALADYFISSPTRAVCESLKSEDECIRTDGCDIFVSKNTKMCAAQEGSFDVSGEGELEFEAQGIDDFDILLADAEGGVLGEVGIEILTSLEDDVVSSTLAGFGGWELGTNFAVYQFLAGNLNAGQSASAGIGTKISRDEIEIGPERSWERGNDFAVTIPAARFRTRN
ncbi:hypothetical protein BSKO_08037 [Bryopsis sp. KO-2023]|nr:hypothetical protein BSKO_08037 [Bryopsis sp. KO-2023]